MKIMSINKHWNLKSREINKKYKNAISSFSVFDFSKIVSKIEGYEDSSFWGITVNNNVVYIGNDKGKRGLKIEFFHDENESNETRETKEETRESSEEPREEPREPKEPSDETREKEHVFNQKRKIFKKNMFLNEKNVEKIRKKSYQKKERELKKNNYKKTNFHQKCHDNIFYSNEITDFPDFNPSDDDVIDIEHYYDYDYDYLYED